MASFAKIKNNLILSLFAEEMEDDNTEKSAELSRSILNVLNQDTSILDAESFSHMENAANMIGIQCLQY